MNDRADRFEWSGGHPALDLVNTLDERPSHSPIENLATYRDLVLFAKLAGLIEPPIAARLLSLDGPSCSRIVKRARKLREHLHDILAATNSGRPARRRDLDAISAAVQAAHAAQVLAHGPAKRAPVRRHAHADRMRSGHALVASPSPGFASHRWSAPLAPDIALHACSLAVEHLLVDEDRGRIRKCGAADCDVYYVDASKGRRRQWCSMKGCGNREKQRRWRSGAQ
jgi:predicted RNA-binding Zn ribbon-like protein